MIVFDLDDTLYKETHYVDSGIRAVAKEAEEAGVMSETSAYELVKTSPDTSSGFDRLAAAALRSEKAQPFDIQRILAIYRYHTPQISLPTDTLVTLRQLRDSNVSLGLITDGRSVTQRAKIQSLGLDQFITDDNILISQEIGTDKHWPTAFEEIMKRNPKEISFTYIGDNPEKDFLWPNRLGWHTAMLLDIAHQNIHPQNIIGITPTSEYAAKQTISNIIEVLDMI